MTSADLPIDPPLALSGAAPQRRGTGPDSRLGTGNTSSDARLPLPTVRLGKHGLAALREELSERDWAVLRSIAAHRFLTTTHVQALHFTAHRSSESAARTCRQVLTRLKHQRIIRTLERRIGGLRAGSASYVWTTDTAGRRLLDADADSPQRRHHEPSERLLRHALAIADTHLSLIAVDARRQIELLSVQLEPDCWRPFIASGGQRSVVQPDLYVTTGIGDYEDAWFIEVDLGTEHLPTLVRKCQQYETYRRTGIEQQRHGSFPWVVWLLRTDERVLALQATLRRTRSVDPELFKVMTPETLTDVMTNNNQLKGGDYA